MEVSVKLTRAQALAVLNCDGFSNGHGVRKSQALTQAEDRIVDAIQAAWNAGTA
jgi:hypothetical protein